MEQISVVIITLNEEKNIGRCLESVKSVADEILVIDSGSHDRTEEICKKYQAKFIYNPWPGYSAQKNFGASKASHNLILSLDADESLSPGLETSILKAKQNPDADAWTMNRLTNYCGRWIKFGGWYPDRKLRLYRRDKGKWEGSIHEKICMAKGAVIKHLAGDILHYSYYTFSDHLRQIDSFSMLAAESLHTKGKKSSYLKLIYKPMYRFIRSYFLKGGFRDGFYGYVIARNSAYSSFLRYARLMDLQKKSKTKS